MSCETLKYLAMIKLLIPIIVFIFFSQNLFSQSCSKSTLIIKTGINEDGSVVPVGAPLNFWKITSGPVGTGLYPRRVYCVSTFNGWHQYPNTSWVNLHPSPTTISQGMYNYQRCFCIDSADTFRIKLNIMVDDFGTFYLRNAKSGTRIKLGEAKAGWNFFIDTTKKTNYPGSHDDINIDTNLYLTKGRYCIDFPVGDGGSGVATGLNVDGSITSIRNKSFAFLKDKCCNDPCYFDNRIDDSSYCEGGKIKHNLILNPENKEYKWETGESSRRKYADITGKYKAYILNILDGDSCWGYVERNILIEEMGYLIDKLKDSICVNCKDEIILKSLPFNPLRKWKKDGIILSNLAWIKVVAPGKYCTYFNDSVGCIDSICIQIKGRNCPKSYCDSLASSSINAPNLMNLSSKDRMSISLDLNSKSVLLKLDLTNEFMDYAIRVVDLLGKTITLKLVKKPLDNEVIMNFSKYNSGLYFYILEGDGIILDTKKLVIPNN